MTNFKRIALVAIAALGMGVLSSVPSQALYLTTPTLTITNGTPTKSSSDSRTAGTITVAWNTNSGGTAGDRDTITITATAVSYPAAATAVPRLNLMFSDTTGSQSAVTTPFSVSSGSAVPAAMTAGMGSISGGIPATDSVSATATAGVVLGSGTTTGYQVTKLFAFLDTTQARASGTYTFTIVATQSGIQYGAGSKSTGAPITGTLTFTVAALDSESTVASAGSSSAFLHSAASGTPTADITSSLLATSSTTARAWL